MHQHTVVHHCYNWGRADGQLEQRFDHTHTHTQIAVDGFPGQPPQLTCRDQSLPRFKKQTKTNKLFRLHKLGSQLRVFCIF